MDPDVEKHAVYVEGPLRHPGGKDGTWVMRCTCGQWSSRPYESPASRDLWAAARSHQLDSRGL